MYIWQSKKWPDFSWNSDRLINLVSQARIVQGKLIQEIESLGFYSMPSSQAEFLIEETTTTAAIEGEQLNREAVRSSVARRLGLPTVGLQVADRNIEGLIDVLQDATNNYEKPLTIERLKSWQAALFPTGYSGLHKIKTGHWRGEAPMQVVSGPVGKEKVHFEAPPHHLLNSEMKKFVHWWNFESLNMDGLLRASTAHFYFVTLHPFEDGNGRIARALTDLALTQDEKISQRFYSLSSRIMSERSQYYEVLESCQKGTLDITDWMEWFLGCFTRALQDSGKTIEKTLQKTKFWQYHSEVDLNQRQRKVINRLLEAGQEGFVGGLTTRKYTAMTKTSRATAFREISDLVEKKILIPQEGRGRSTSYSIVLKDKF